MKRIFGFFFNTLGVIFFILILVGAYLYIFDPLGIRSSTLNFLAPAGERIINVVGTEDRNSLLTPTQERALETIGVDSADLPQEITPEMEECFTEKLGESRVSEIKAGDMPSAAEFFKVKGCL